MALQELLVGTSFLVIQTIVNTFGVTASAGVGVAEKVCVFLMLVPSAYMHSMSAFVAQNMGAGQPRRAKRALGYGILTAFAAGLVMAWLAFFHGDALSLLFAKDAAVAAASHSYLKAYAIDCMLTPFLFCFMGYYNGCEKTLFVMIRGSSAPSACASPSPIWSAASPGPPCSRLGWAPPPPARCRLSCVWRCSSTWSAASAGRPCAGRLLGHKPGQKFPGSGLAGGREEGVGGA